MRLSLRSCSIPTALQCHQQQSQAQLEVDLGVVKTMIPVMRPAELDASYRRVSLRRPLSGFVVLALILVCTWLVNSASTREPVVLRTRIRLPAVSLLPASEAAERPEGTPHMVGPTDVAPVLPNEPQRHPTEVPNATAGAFAPSPSSALLSRPKPSVVASLLASASSLLGETPAPAVAPPQAATSSTSTQAAQDDKHAAPALQPTTQSQRPGAAGGFAALRRSLADNLHDKAPKCALQGTHAPNATLSPENSADAARAAATVALCRKDRQPSARLHTFLQAFLRLQAQLREPRDAAAVSPAPLWLQGAIAWQWRSGGGGVGDQLKGMLATLAAALLSPQPAPFYLMLQPTTMPGWVPADIDWRLSSEEAQTIASVQVRPIEEVPGVSYVRRGESALQLPTTSNTSVSPAVNVSVAHVSLDNDAGQVGNMLIRPVLRESSKGGITLVRSNVLGPSAASTAAWPPGRCPAAWYGTRTHGLSGEPSGSPQSPTSSTPADAVAISLGSRNMSLTCLAHLPKELQCWFLQTEVSRLQREKQEPHAVLQAVAQEACTEEGTRVGEVGSSPWFSGARLLYLLLDAMVRPSPGLAQRIAAATRVDSPTVHVLQPQLLSADSQAVYSSRAASAASGSPGASPLLGSENVSVFAPGRQYVIGVHLRLGDGHFEGHDTSGQAADAERAARLAAHCADMAAAELTRRYGPRQSVVWIVASDNPLGRANLLHLAAHLHQNEAATRSNATLHTPVAAVVTLANETAHVDKLGNTDPALRDALSLDAYAEHALLSAAHALVKTHSGFSRTAAVLGNVPLVLDIRPGTGSSADGFGLDACAETTESQGWSEEGLWWKRRRLRSSL